LAREHSDQFARSKDTSVVASGLLLQLSSRGGASRRGDLKDCFITPRRDFYPAHAGRNDKKGNRTRD